MAPPAALIVQLEAIVGAARLRRRPLELALFTKDAGMIRGAAPEAVTFPESREESVALVEVARTAGVPVVTRGTGTGLAGGAVPNGGVLVVTTRMNRVLEVDPEAGTAWVESGALNLDLTRHTARWALHFAPDPSSQAACTIGGNVAANAGGPHALAEGATAEHILAVEIITASGEVLLLGGAAPDPPGLDLRAVVVGSEGTLGLITRILVRLTPDPPAARTLLMGFDTLEQAAETVSEIVAAGVVPAALELMDRPLVRAVERFCGAGYPTEAAAVLLAEVAGHPAAIESQAARIAETARAHGAAEVQMAGDDRQRELLWRGRRAALGSLAQIAPNYYIHDIVVPRARLAETVTRLHAIAERHRLAMVVFAHAGDGNLHPTFAFDASDPLAVERVAAAGAEVVALPAAFGGTLSGEHGIGLEKAHAMPLFFGPADLQAQALIRNAFDPGHLFNPGKVLPEIPGSTPSAAAAPLTTTDLARLRVDDVEGVPDAPFVIAPASLDEAAAILRAASAEGLRVLPWGGGTHQGYGGRIDADIALLTRGLRGVVEWRPEDLVVVVEAGTPVEDLEDILAEKGQTALLPEVPAGATVGGCVAAAASGWRRLRFGPIRNRVLEVAIASSDGRVVRSGARVVKNATGYDLARLAVGSFGSLGLVGRVCLKLWPRPEAAATVTVEDPVAALRSLYRPWAVLETNGGALAYLAGGRAEVEAQAATLGGRVEDGHRWPEPLGNEVVVAMRVPPPRIREAVATLPATTPYQAAHGVGEVLAGFDQPDLGLLGDLRRWAEGIGGSLVVTAAPDDFYRGFDPWGTPPTSMGIQRRVKAVLDPAGVMAPGRLPGRL